MSREFTREEMEIIANKCGVPVLPDNRAAQGRLKGPCICKGMYYDEDGYWIDSWADNAETMAAVMRSEAFKPNWSLKKDGPLAIPFYIFDENWHVDSGVIKPELSSFCASPSTAVLEAVLEGGK